MVDVTNRTNVAVRLRPSKLLFGHDTLFLTMPAQGRKNAVALGGFGTKRKLQAKFRARARCAQATCRRNIMTAEPFSNPPAPRLASLWS
ncbi:hypothetical protein QO058_03765 [Bosea vestrisii]|uniref:hypothetical protein n=1 Tax=Bosea vestrisii TaxID=151416 RepID=UPI0024DFDDFE|nr:hypothetical protein [Bosea vestrisii]WID99652.1 hypothetical protein QO058_03765 [Bosea vestrisii]